MAQLFISYSTHNADFARYLRGLLQNAGFDVWMDETKLSAGQSWTDSLEANIRTCAAFVIIMSTESKASEWVRRERLLAERLHKPMFPILYSGEVWWDLANIQYEDMQAGLNARLSQRLIDALHRAVNGEPPLAEGESVGTHVPTPAPAAAAQTDSRKLEAAMPAETKSGSDTELWAKISLPTSEGLRGELPAAVPSGDVIQKGDTRVSSFPIRFPVDARTGQRHSVQAELRLSSPDFKIAAPGERVEVEIPPDADSRTVIFTLEANPNGKTSGRSRIMIDLIYEARIIAQVSVSTVLVERVTASVPTWNLAALGYIAASTGAAAPGTPAVVEDILRDVPPTVEPAKPTTVPAEIPETSQPDEEVERGIFGSGVTLDAHDSETDIPLEADADVNEPAEQAKIGSAAFDDYTPADTLAHNEKPTPVAQPAEQAKPSGRERRQPAMASPAAPQYSGSATRSGDAEIFDQPAPQRPAPRRASNTPLRLASLFAALALVFVVVLAITRENTTVADIYQQQTSFALLPTDTSGGQTGANDLLTQQAATALALTLNAQTVATNVLPLTDASVGLVDVAVAPMLNCFGSPGTHLVDALKRAGLNPVLLDKGFSNQGDARDGTDAPVIAWGVCRNNTLVFSLELLHALQKNATDPQSITIQVPSSSLGQDDSHAVQLTGALVNYALGRAYNMQAQIFASLSQEAINSDEHAALLKLWSNSLSYLK